MNYPKEPILGNDRLNTLRRCALRQVSLANEFKVLFINNGMIVSF